MHKVKHDITEEGTLEDFLGVKIDKKKDGVIHLTHPLSIELILKDLNILCPSVSTRTHPPDLPEY